MTYQKMESNTRGVGVWVEAVIETLEENIKMSKNMSALHMLSFHNLTWRLTASEER